MRGACYATSPTGIASSDAGIAGGVAPLYERIPKMSREGQRVPIGTAIVRVHADEITGYGAGSSVAPRKFRRCSATFTGPRRLADGATTEAASGRGECAAVELG